MPLPTLHHCHRCDEVVRLQLMLRELNFALEPDGFFGPMTREAVKTFQARHGLKQTGCFSAKDWDELEKCYSQIENRTVAPLAC